MTNAINKNNLLEWLDIEIELSKDNNDVLKADKWAFQQVKKIIESGRFDIKDGLPVIENYESEFRMDKWGK